MEKLSGPYLNKRTGRLFVIGKNHKGFLTTMSWARYLMQEYIGRELTQEETVDHINRDKTDDRLENLQILTRSEHAKKDNWRSKSESCK